MTDGSGSVEVCVQSAAADVPGCPAAARFRAWVGAALEIAKVPAERRGSVTVRLTGVDESAGLNARYRGRSGPTNVLAFPAPPLPAAVTDRELGDLAICVDVAAREAREQGKRLEDHLAHLVVHGTLHLLGYDHENPTTAREMEALERRVLAALGIADPYEAAGAG